MKQEGPRVTVGIPLLQEGEDVNACALAYAAEEIQEWGTVEGPAFLDENERGVHTVDTPGRQPLEIEGNS